MTIVLPALGVAFAATRVWLTVRIVNRREKWLIRLTANAGLLAGLINLGYAAGTAAYWYAKQLR